MDNVITFNGKDFIDTRVYVQTCKGIRHPVISVEFLIDIANSNESVKLDSKAKKALNSMGYFNVRFPSGNKYIRSI